VPECPTCGKSLETEAGTRQHHAKVHGESLPNRTCVDCGTDFYDPKSRLSYCDGCDPNAGENNGNWQGGRERTECRRCGDEFEYYPSDKKGVYCPDCVREADEFLGDHYAEVHDIERVERECEYCGEEMMVLVSERKYGHGRFCSLDCLSEWMSETRSGNDHHQWLTGSRTYAGKWWSARRRARRRDRYRCQNCRKTAAEIGRNPDVHHIVPLRTFDDPQDAHTLDNLLSLCPECHRQAEYGTIEIPSPGDTQE